MFTGGVDLATPEQVGADTFVRLRREDGTPREHTIYAEAPIDPSLHEMGMDDGSVAGLLGRRVGDVVERDAGHWSGQRSTVEEILPAAVHAARQVMATFHDDFPGEPFFVGSIHVGDGTAVSDWTGLLAALGERQERVSTVLRLYHDQALPLEFVATLVQCDVPELMLAAKEGPPLAPLLVEWSDNAGQDASVAAAANASSVVVTRSGLATMQRLGILDLLAAHYDVVVPTSLLWQVRLEVAKAKKAVDAGRSTMMLAPYGPRIEDVAANDPRLVRAFDEARGCLEWLERSTRKEPRPYRTVQELGSPSEVLREQLGPPSYDAVALAESGAGALFADDLGLRKLTLGFGPRTVSFSTLALLEAFTASGVMSTLERDRHLVDLLLGGHAFVRPTIGILEEGLRRMPGLGREGLRTAFGTLGGPIPTALGAASLSAQMIKVGAMTTIQTVGVDAITEMSVRAMSARWPLALATRLVRQEATRELALLPPQYLQTVVRTCTALAAESIPKL